MEALYIVTLLGEAFGFEGHARDITLALKVQGLEVEWTLGYMLAEVLPRLDGEGDEGGERGDGDVE